MMIIRLGFFAALVAAATAALYEYEDGGSAFNWLHSILTGMSVTVAVAASILTVCGLRACTNSTLRDTLAHQRRRGRRLLVLLLLKTSRSWESAHGSSVTQKGVRALS